VADPTDPPTPPGQQPWPRTPVQPPAWGPGWGQAWGPPPDTTPPDGRAAPPWPPYYGPPPPERPPARNPLPRPAGTPRMLRLELGLVLLLAFSPGILGLLILALGPEGSAEVEAQLVPSVVSIVFELFLSWSPVLVVGFLLARNREGWAGIGLTRFRGGDLGMGLILWVASFVLVLVLAQLFQYFGQREVDFLPEGLPLWFRSVQAVLIAVTAGVTEEIVVRGYAQTRLEQLRAPTAVIILLPTALWGVLHAYQGAGAALTIFGLGLMYAWYFLRPRRLGPLTRDNSLFAPTLLVFTGAGASRPASASGALEDQVEVDGQAVLDRDDRAEAGRLDLEVAHLHRELAHDLDGRPVPAPLQVEVHLAGHPVDREPALALAADLLALDRRGRQLDGLGQLQGGRRVLLRLQAALADGVVTAGLVAGQLGQVGLDLDRLHGVAGHLHGPGHRGGPADRLVRAAQGGQLLPDPVADI